MSLISSIYRDGVARIARNGGEQNTMAKWPTVTHSPSMADSHFYVEHGMTRAGHVDIIAKGRLSLHGYHGKPPEK